MMCGRFFPGGKALAVLSSGTVPFVLGLRKLTADLRDANQNVEGRHWVEEAAALTCGHAPWPGACLPKTPASVEIAGSANTLPARFLVLPTFTLKREVPGRLLALETIPCIMLRNCYILSPQFRAQDAFLRGENPLKQSAYSQL